MTSAEKEYQIERIVDKKVDKGRSFYKVKWEGFPMSQCTWEPSSHFAKAKEYIEDYEARIHNIANSKNLKESIKPEKKDSQNMTSSKINDDNSETIENQKDCKNKIAKKPNATFKTIKKKQINKKKEQKTSLLETKSDDDIVISIQEERKISNSPLKIVKASQINKDSIVYVVEWKDDPTGVKPSNSELSSEILRVKYPSLLIQYLESKIRYKK